MAPMFEKEFIIKRMNCLSPHCPVDGLKRIRVLTVLAIGERVGQSCQGIVQKCYMGPQQHTQHSTVIVTYELTPGDLKKKEANDRWISILSLGFYFTMRLYDLLFTSVAVPASPTLQLCRNCYVITSSCCLVINYKSVAIYGGGELFTGRCIWKNSRRRFCYLNKSILISTSLPSITSAIP